MPSQRQRIISLMLVLCSFAITAIVVAQEPSQSTPPSALFDEMAIFEMPHRNMTPISEPLPNVTNTPRFAGFMNWTKLVFQSYRNMNWEIYTADATGNAVQRLTSDVSRDIYPHANRGFTKIVFTSNRTGNYEIFSMNVDGSNLQQLTHNAATDTYPKWSPDGTKIAFQSYRDGVSEIYVMNADGTAQTRITTDGQGSGHPDWSPDGTQIAYASLRDGPPRIWVINADGSDPFIVTHEPFADIGYPVWSPDGEQIAFAGVPSSDTNRHGIWIYSKDGTAPFMNIPQINGFSNQVIPASWPAGDALAYTEISFITYQGVTYWKDAHFKVLDSSISIADTGLDWHPRWQVTENTPPSVSISSPLPFGYRYGTLVSWEKIKDGAEGFNHFRVQYREGTGAWVDWFANTTRTSALFSGASGEDVTFRVTGIDNAYNHALWKSTPIIKLYATDLSGSVTDVRGKAIGIPDISISPQPANTTYNKSDGRYSAAIIDDGNAIVTTAATGYQPLTMTISMDRNRMGDIHLTAQPDLISNGGFENLSGSGWTLAGEVLPEITQTYKHTGNRALLLGRSPTYSLTLSTFPEFDVSAPQAIFFDKNNTLHVIYDSTPYSGSSFLMHKEFDGISWSAVDSIGDHTWSTLIRTAVLSNNEIDVFWLKQGSIFIASRNPNNSWSAPYNPTPEEHNILSFDIATRPNDEIAVAYSLNDGTVKYIFRSANGDWSQPETIPSGGQLLRIVPDIQGNIHALWNRFASGYSINQRTVAGDWTPQMFFLDDYYSWVTGLFIDISGNTWVSAGSTNLMKKPAGRRTWETYEIPSKCYVSGASNFRHAASWDHNGDLFAINSNGINLDSRADICHYDRFKDSWISQAFNITGTITAQFLPFDQDNNLHALIRSDSGMYRITNVAHVSLTEHSTATQTVAIPADMYEPTLSFAYLADLQHAGANTFRVIVHEEGRQTAVFSTTTDSDEWQYTWVDLSPWKGKTISITFDSITAAGAYPGRVYLDDVSISSWLTPVPSSVSPSRTDLRQAEVITVTGDNFLTLPPVGGTINYGDDVARWAQIQLGDIPLDTYRVNSTTLTATVPITLPRGMYDVIVANPTGQSGILPNSFVATAYIYLPLISK